LAFRRGGAVLRYVVADDPHTAIRIGRRFRFPEATTQIERPLADADLDVLVVGGRTHSPQTLDAIRRASAAGKQVVLESLPAGAARDEAIAAGIDSGRITLAEPQRFARRRWWRFDRGHAAWARVFVEAFRRGESLASS
jgi:hypothetical protein